MAFVGVGLVALSWLLFIILLSVNNIARKTYLNALGDGKDITAVCRWTKWNIDCDATLWALCGDWDYGDDGSQKSMSPLALAMNIIGLIVLTLVFALLFVPPLKRFAKYAFWVVLASALFALIGVMAIIIGSTSDGGCWEDNIYTEFAKGLGYENPVLVPGWSFYLNIAVCVILPIAAVLVRKRYRADYEDLDKGLVKEDNAEGR
mmetsp:Transcript_26111/g.42666  ORF Transcript_26111/g.42666 Transcript_26111/m.42666 type:complete len:205 (-) Transcript_26111:32-646(-)